MRVFQRRTFLTSASACAASHRVQLKGEENRGSHFKLKNRGRAILSEENYRNVIFIPPSAMVTLLEGKVLLILSEGLRIGGELWGKWS